VDGLLERGEQLAALESVVEAARDGRGRLVLVAGEAGIGKTSLVRALRGRLDCRAALGSMARRSQLRHAFLRPSRSAFADGSSVAEDETVREGRGPTTRVPNRSLAVAVR
jgi:chloramphenicol 3-O-phosphotransferase